MPVTIKSNLVKIRDNPNAAYTSMDVISDSTTAERIQQITNTANAAQAQITNTANTAQTQITSAVNTAQTQIENKKNAALNSIPSDYTTLSNAVTAEITAREAADLEHQRRVLAAFPTDTASGEVVSIPDGADNLPIKQMQVAIEPVQDLHGYDYPWPAGGGKNRLPNTATYPSTKNGVTFTKNTNGTVSFSGTTSSADFFFEIGSVLLDAGEYILSGAISSTKKLRIANGSTLIGHDSGSGFSFTLSEATTVTVEFRISDGSNVAVSGTFSPMIRLASETDATFEPYSNICPITGWTGASVTRAGKNLIEPPDHVVTRTEQGKTFVVNPDGSIVVTNTEKTGKIGEKNILYNLGVLHLPKGVPLSASGWIDGKVQVKICYALADNVTRQWTDVNAQNVTIPEDAISSWARISVAGTTEPFGAVTIYPMIRLATETDAIFEPYAGNTYNITFPTSASTVYGGTLDVVTGELVVDRKSVVFNGTENWQWSTLTERPYINLAANNMKQYSRLLCSHYQYSSAFTAIDKTVTTNAGGGATAGYGMWFKDSVNADSVDAWKQYLAAQNAAGTPVTVIYELATPVTYTLTPQDIKTLLGANNIWSDTGTVDMEYRADTKLYIEKLTAPTEDDMIADHAISANTFFMVGNQLFRATTAIASGATITVGTNATKLSLSDALNALA